MALWRLKGCERCMGDLVLALDEWRCCQCGHYYYPDLPQTELLPPQADPMGGSGRRRGRLRGGYVERNINLVIRAQTISNERWWACNQQIVTYLDEGRSIQEISALTFKGMRQIRVARERLASIRDHTDVEERADRPKPKTHQAVTQQPGNGAIDATTSYV